MPWFIIGQDTDKNKTPLYIKYAFEIAKQYAPDVKFVFNHYETTIGNSWWNLIEETIGYINSEITADQGIIPNAFLKINNDSVPFNEEGIARVYNYAFQQLYNCQIISDNFRTYSGAVFLETDTLLNIVLILSDVQQLKTNNFIHVYPNPTPQFLNVKSDISFSESHIYCVSVQKIKQIQNNSNFVQINVCELENGHYFLKCISNEKGKSKTLTFVVNR